MSLDTVVEDIRDEAEAEAERILEEARAEAERIQESAEAEAEEIVETAESEVEREIERERDQRLSSANLEAKQQRLEARREALAAVRERVEAAIEDLPEDERAELTRALLDDAAEEFADADAVAVYAREADQTLVEDILSEYEGFSYAGSYDCLGGVVVESEAGRLRVNNTFDSVLEDVWEENLKALSDTLFEDR